MSDAQEYRRFAAECVALSRATASPSHEVHLLLMAERWLDLAYQVHRSLAESAHRSTKPRNCREARPVPTRGALIPFGPARLQFHPFGASSQASRVVPQSEVEAAQLLVHANNGRAPGQQRRSRSDGLAVVAVTISRRTSETDRLRTGLRSSRFPLWLEPICFF
jgi:hypothetical protein